MWSAGCPQFQIGGVVQPLSWGCQNFWSDYSLKHASFAFLCSSSIAGNGTLTVALAKNGTTPTTSARTLSEVYNQSLQVNLVGVVGLSGTWTGVVANNALNVEQITYLDGAAGKWWRIHTHAGQFNSAHGQVEVYHYIGALTDHSGNLGGFRYVPRVSQPWYNVNSPALNVYAANLSWQYGAGPTTVSWNWPFNTVNFTTTASSTTCTLSSGSHNFYQGAVDGGINAVPGVFTASGGNLDTALSTGTVYWASNITPSNNPPNNTQFQVFATPGAAGSTGNGPAITMTGNATGTMTFTPTPHILPLQSIFDLANDGQPKFFQGTGSFTADSTVMTQFNCAYLVSTGLIQPFDTSYTGMAFGGTIVDNNDASVLGTSWNYNWTPTTTGPVALNGIGTAGEHDYLGPLTQYAARHFYNQSAFSAKIVRMMATSSDFFGVSAFRDSVSANYANLSANTYSGMPATGMARVIANTHGQFLLPSGITLPPPNSQFFCIGEPNGAHKPSLAYWAGLVFADPHFIDLTIEAGIGSVTNCGIGLRNFSSPLPNGTGIVGWLNIGGLRGAVWELRDMIHGAIIAPQLHPDGSQSCDMMRDYANNNLDYLYSTQTSTFLGSYFYGIGRYNPFSVPANQASPRFDNSNYGFQAGYMLNVLPLGVSALENSNTLSLLNFMANGWQHYMNTFGGYYLYPEDDFAVFLDSGGNSYGPISNDSYWGISFQSWGVTFLNWTNAGSPYFSVDAFASNAPVNGDIVMFDGSGQAAPGGMSPQVPYYIRDISGTTFNLAATVGGPAIAPSNTGRQQVQATGGGGGPYAMSKLASWTAASTGNTPSSNGAYNSYCAVKWSGWSFANAVGATGYGTIGSAGYSLIGDALKRLQVSNKSYPFVGGPTYLAATSL